MSGSPPGSNDRSRRRKPPSDAVPDTRERLLAAAEELFGTQGVDATSLRALTAQAGANLAAVNYHFGSKEGLIREVFGRRLRPVNETRHALFDAIEASDSPSEEKLHRLVEAFIGPILQFVAEDPEIGLRCSRMMGRAMVTPSPEVKRVLRDELQPTAVRFLELLRELLPQLPRDELFVRFQFMIGAMAHYLSPPEAFTEVLSQISGMNLRDQPPELVMRRFVDFVVAGLTRPSVAAESTARATDSSPCTGDPSS